MKPTVNLFETQVSKVIDITDDIPHITTNSEIPKIEPMDINLTMTKESKLY